MLKLLCISIYTPNFSLDFQHFNGQNGQAGGTASLCQILSKSLELRPRYCNFSIFKMAAAAILNFQNLKFVTFGTVKSVELRNHAKFLSKSL